MTEEQRLRIKCNQYAKRLVLLGEDDVVWEAETTLQNATPNSDYAKPVLYQCPYDPSCKCAMDEPCKGCETWHPDFA